jgi:hypothetical protein
MDGQQWLAITEADFTGWVLRALRRAGYLAAHVNAVATCECCRRRKCPCKARAVAKMEPGLPDIIAVSPFPDAPYPLVLAELKDATGRVSTKRGEAGRRQVRTLPSQRDWLNALRKAVYTMTQGRGVPLIGEVWRPHDARRIQETIIFDNGVEREPWALLDEYEKLRKLTGVE